MSKKKVALYIGHGKSTDGGWDCGCSYRRGGKLYTEAEICKAIVKYASEFLKGYSGKITVITDYPKNDKNMIKQVAEANAKKANYFVSVHCNYSGQVQKGTMPLYVSTKGRKLAVSVNKSVTKGAQMPTLGLKKRTDLYELNATNMPACIFEVGGIKSDFKKLTSKKWQKKIGEGIATGILKHCGVI